MLETRLLLHLKRNAALPQVNRTVKTHLGHSFSGQGIGVVVKSLGSSDSHASTLYICICGAHSKIWRTIECQHEMPWSVAFGSLQFVQ
jgi:hypothetical protein